MTTRYAYTCVVCGERKMPRKANKSGYCRPCAHEIGRPPEWAKPPGRPRVDVHQRFMSYVDVNDDGCWRWAGKRNWGGYSSFWCDGATVAAHRWSYEYHRGPIPDGLTIDHLCRVRDCVNPCHMEAVTMEENRARGNHPGKRTHCPQGHPYDETNTGRISTTGDRYCKTCARLRARQRYWRKKAAA